MPDEATKVARISEDRFFDRACRVTVSYRTFARLFYFRKTPKEKSRVLSQKSSMTINDL